MKLHALALLAAISLPACVQTGAEKAARPDPAMVAAEAATGVSAENIVAYSGNGVGLGVVIAGLPDILFYKSATTDKAQLKAAPARICGGRGVAAAQDMDLEHPEQLPGVRKLVVTCK